MNDAPESLDGFYQKVITQIRLQDEARFWVNTKKVGDCLIWTGAPTKSGGYGIIGVYYKSFRAHRFSYLLNCGPIPRGLFVCHKCDTPLCVNPSHLFLGTHAENMRDMCEKKRQAYGERCFPKRRVITRHFGDANGSRKHPERLKRGKDNSNSKLTAETVIAIRARYAARGVSYRTLAKEFGVSWTAIFHAITKKTWKYIP